MIGGEGGGKGREYSFCKTGTEHSIRKGSGMATPERAQTGKPPRHTQGETPVAAPLTCQTRKNVYGRKPLRVNGYVTSVRPSVTPSAGVPGNRHLYRNTRDNVSSQRMPLPYSPGAFRLPNKISPEEYDLRGFLTH